MMPADRGTLLSFSMAPTHRAQNPNFPFETALRLGVPISERALQMGDEQYRLPAQSALLATGAPQPSGMYTVRTSSLPVDEPRQAGGVLPQMARMWGAPPTPGPVLLEPKAAVAYGDRLAAPYMSAKEAKKDATSARAQESVNATVRQTRDGLAEMSARYKTNMVPFGAAIGDGQHYVKTLEAHARTDGVHPGSLGAGAPQSVLNTSRYANDGKGIVTTAGPPTAVTHPSLGATAPPRGPADMVSPTAHHVGAPGVQQRHPQVAGFVFRTSPCSRTAVASPQDVYAAAEAHLHHS